MKAGDLEAGLATPAAVTLALEPLLSSSRTGIVSDLAVHRPAPADAADAAGATTVVGRLAGGKAVGCNSFDPTTARAAALGEAVERYAVATAAGWMALRHHGVADALAHGAVDPATMATVAASEIPELADMAPYDPADAHAELDWVPAWLLHDGTPVLLPAQGALAAYRPPPGQTRFTWASTSGSGAGNTLAEAIRSGLTELIERDAFARTWLARRQVCHIDLDAVTDSDIVRWRDHHRGLGRQPSLALLTGEVDVPVIAAQVTADRGRAYVAGFGAGLDPARAMRRAVEEAGQVGHLLSHLERVGARRPGGAHEVRTLEDQTLFWQDPGRLSQLDFLTTPSEFISPGDLLDEGHAKPRTPREDVFLLLDRLERAGYRAAGFDIMPPDLRGLPLRVATIVVPGLQPVRMGRRPWCLDNPRLPARPELNTLPPPFA